MKTATYCTTGTHCHSCELLIEKEIGKISGINKVIASVNQKNVTIIGENIPSTSHLNQLFKKSGYTFSTLPVKQSVNFKPDIFTSLLISIAILFLYFLAEKSGLLSKFNVSTDSLLPAYFVFGLLAGFSTCAALIGGIVLSLSQRGFGAVVSFNLGRLILFGIFGAILGYFGSFFHLSIIAGAIISLIVAIIMIILALQLIGVRQLDFINLSLPKSLTSRFSDESKFTGQYLTFILGGLTFFLPCGFTLTTQSLALATGSPYSGALIMFTFALGTLLPLFLIGYSSIRSHENPRISAYFSQVAGILVLVFALFSLNSQLNVLGFSSIKFSNQNNNPQNSDLPLVVDGKQIVKMDASYRGYIPNIIKVKAGVPVRWEITDKGTSGCTNAIISTSLLEGPINLVPGTTTVREFVAPSKPGTYTFSCWMGMVSGSFEVIN